MNDRTHELEGRLLQATAPKCPTEKSEDAGVMDPETASLREGWLAFGQLLEAAQPMADASEIEELLPSPRSKSNKRSPRWKASLTAALAASLVIGATLAWNLIPRGADIAVEDPAEEVPKPSAIAQEDPPEEDVIEDNVEENMVAENAVDELKWDDSIDDQLASVSKRIMRVEGDWDCLDDAFSPAWQGIDEIDQDIEEGTL